jgi:hypothetical protein
VGTCPKSVDILISRPVSGDRRCVVMAKQYDREWELPLEAIRLSSAPGNTVSKIEMGPTFNLLAYTCYHFIILGIQVESHGANIYTTPQPISASTYTGNSSRITFSGDSLAIAAAV